MIMRLVVWIVEIQFDEWPKDRWEPTVAAALTREDGRILTKTWARKNPTAHFRLRQYTALRPQP